MRHMRKAAVSMVLMSALSVAVAQSNTQKAARAKKAPAMDAQIASALKDVSPKQMQATIEKLVSFGSRLSIGPVDQATIDSHQGVGAAREWIKSEFQRYSDACGGCLEVKEDRFPAAKNARIPEGIEMVNVYAIQKGTDPEAAKRIYLVTGHYDSRPSDTMDPKTPAPGANDDGSGTAVSIECARVLSKHKFPATIIYLTVEGEEQGLIGAQHFAKMAKSEGWELQAVLNNDIVGGDRSPGQNTHQVRVFSEGIPLPLVSAPPQGATPEGGDTAQQKMTKLRSIRTYGEENDSPSRQLARFIAEQSNRYLARGVSVSMRAGSHEVGNHFEGVMEFRPDRFGRGGDHTAFNQEGFAAVRITEWQENYHHQHQNPRTENGIEYGDLPKFVDYDYMANVARLNAATLALLASAPAPPSGVKIEAAKQENVTELQWTAAPGAASYEVVYRPTTSPTWDEAKNVGDVTTFTMNLSKDDYVFAVRSLDAKGHRSLAVMPVPFRERTPSAQ